VQRVALLVQVRGQHSVRGVCTHRYSHPLPVDSETRGEAAEIDDSAWRISDTIERVSGPDGTDVLRGRDEAASRIGRVRTADGRRSEGIAVRPVVFTRHLNMSPLDCGVTGYRSSLRAFRRWIAWFTIRVGSSD
jgi:hypothetical protein